MQAMGYRLLAAMVSEILNFRAVSTQKVCRNPYISPIACFAAIMPKV